ncbi:PAS domain-containing sensor histidine kinase [Desulfomicrobium norvegicum]|nr:PAS domain-containing sensor histidine kinase [Desulfomicrobium norvegicum]
MNAVFPSALHFDAGLPAFLALLLSFGTISLLLGALLIVLARLRSNRSSLETRIRELRSAYEKIETLSHERREFEEKFQAIFDNSPYSIAFNALDGTYLGANKAFLSRWGISREEALTRSVQDLAAVDNDERLRFIQMLERDGSFSNMETKISRPDGAVGYVLFSASLVSIGGLTSILSTAVDVTSLKEAEQSVKRWRQKFDLTTAAAKLTFYEYDVDNDVLSWSGSMLDVLGYNPQEMRGGLDVWTELLHPEDADRATALFEEALSQKKRYIIEYRLRRKDGSYADVFEYGQLFARTPDSPKRVLGIIQDVSETKRTEKALMQSEEKYRAIFNNAPIGIFRTSYDGRFLEANPTLARMLGYRDRDELLSSVESLETGIYPHPHTRRDMLEALLVSPGGIRREIEFKRKDGSPFYAVINASLQFDDSGRPAYLDGTIEDITTRRAAEERLRQSEEKFASIFRLSPDGIVLFGLDTQRIQDVNDAFVDLFGFSREELLGKTTIELGMYQTPAVRERLYELIHAKETIRDYELTAYRKSGEEIVCLLSCQLIDINGHPTVFAVIRDLREMKRMQQLMIQTEKMQSLGGLAAGMAHEINNPLGIIVQGVQNTTRRLDPFLEPNIEVARRHELDLHRLAMFLEERNIFRYLKGIRDAGERAADIVSNMLSFSRNSERTFSSNDLSAIASKALELAGKDFDLKKHYDFRRLNIVREYDPALPLVPCVGTEIEQVILNLVRNAAQAMARAGTESPALTLRTKRMQDWAVIEVEDNGPGIPKDELARIFEPFYTTKKIGEGTGLGLSVSYFIITNNHHGHLSASSREGRGAKFVISLPLGQDA